ncbi:hypothetical protein D3C71_1901080 [compost metagenome]
MLLTYCYYRELSSNFTHAVLRTQRLVVEDLLRQLMHTLLRVVGEFALAMVEDFIATHWSNGVRTVVVLFPWGGRSEDMVDWAVIEVNVHV